jgi:hypothetical protein
MQRRRILQGVCALVVLAQFQADLFLFAGDQETEEALPNWCLLYRMR